MFHSHLERSEPRESVLLCVYMIEVVLYNFAADLTEVALSMFNPQSGPSKNPNHGQLASV